MKRKSLFFAFIGAIGFISVLMSCNDNCSSIKESMNRYNNYLEIINLRSKKSITDGERLILNETWHRIEDNIKIVNGKTSLAHTNANELNISEELFEDCKLLLEINNRIAEKKLTRVPRLKSSSENGNPIILEDVKDEVLRQLDSELEKECFEQYWYKLGDYNIKSEDWTSISYLARATIDSTNYFTINSFTRDSITYYRHIISVSGGSYLYYVFGESANFLYVDGGIPVGLNDVYTFNRNLFISQEVEDFGGLDYILLIRGVTPFTIKYGIQENEYDE